jgi:hypothetical protein
MIEQEQVQRFALLFDGYSRAHGRFTVKRTGESGKVEGRASTVHEPPTLEIFRAHLEGSGAGVGIIPLRDDLTCAFAAIDIDVNTIDHAKLDARVKQLKLPLVVCRSKSGGAHLYLFCDPPVPATLVRERLTEWSAFLGHGGCEVFPKQTSRDGSQDVGNWINLAYFQAERTLRPAYRGADALDLPEFLAAAEAARVSQEFLELFQLPQEDSGLFLEGPPCLQHLASQGGFGQGTRNDGMFNVCVYLRKAHADTWEEELQRYNLEFCRPPLNSAELAAIAKSAKRKDYAYRCQQPPIKQHCQRRACLRRQHGVGAGQEAMNGLELGNLTKYEALPGDPVLWGLEVAGQRMLVTTEELFDVNALNKACMARIQRLPFHLPPARWRRYLDDLLRNADVVPVPEDASPTGQLWEWIEQFCLQRAMARSWSEIFTGRPYREAGKVYFRSIDLFAYLDSRRVKYDSQQRVWQLLSDRGAEKKGRNIDGKFVNVWSLPEPTAPAEPERVALPVGQEEF